MSETMYRVKVRVGACEFEAEGPEETVKEAYASFLSAAASAAPATNGSNGNGKHQKNGAQPVNGQDGNEDHRPIAELATQAMQRAFFWKDQEVSLRVLPQTEDSERDALILLLYAYLKVHDRSDVSSLDLMTAVRQSGIPLTRIDRTMPMEFVNRGGRKKSTRYSLNNRGIERAEEILGGMFD